MKITEVKIEGYQSHVNSSFRLSPGLTVITGPSDAGKTAIIRALRWIAFNEPTGEAFLHTIRNPDGSVKEAVEQARVSVTFEDGVTITKTRRKGKTVYTHSLYPGTWEKAEIPPEIKETLGLMKQEYGDFSTCLNFAFQLDAPFMLSETASIGAKVLGKLAGTEVVDKAISEVNKRTNHVRTDISYADKQIGEIDVQLLDYLQLDDQERSLTRAETAYSNLLEAKKRRQDLAERADWYKEYVEKRIAAYDKVEALAAVPVLRTNLEAVERSKKKSEACDDLNRKFWEAVNATRAPKLVLSQTSTLAACSDVLKEVQDDNELCTVIFPKLEEAHTTAKEEAETAYAAMCIAEDLLKTKPQIQQTEEAQKRLQLLSNLWEVYGKTNSNTLALSLRLMDLSLGEQEKDLLKAVEERDKKLGNLYTLQGNLKAAMVIQETRKLQCKEAEATAESAEEELHLAWEEAGGVCPLCGSKGVSL